MKLGAMGKLFRNIVRYVGCGFVSLTVASCGGGGGSAGTVAGSSGATTTTPASISLLFSSVELPSSGATGTDVIVTALVKNSNNNAIASAPVTFTSSSGALTGVQPTTDANGRATASLGTSGDRTNRIITITARSGNITATGTVNVVGTTVTVTGPGTVTSGSTGEFVITVRDQAGVTVPGVPVTISSVKGNPIAIKSSGGGAASAPLTNSQGRVEVTVTGAQAGSDILTASAQGHTFSHSFNVNSLSLVVSTAVSQASISACTAIGARYENSGIGQTGTVNISTSRGELYSDSGCTVALASSSVPVTSGNLQTVYVKSTTVGIATITATAVGGPTAQTNLELVAPTPATINVQAAPAVISPSGTGQSNVSELTVIVRDASNNLVKDAVVEFTIMSDQSGGALSSPVATTLSNGSAKVSFSAGTATTPTNGVQIRARVQGTSISQIVTLTVSRQSLFVTAGTGNSIGTTGNAQYTQDYAVFVTDASGNPVSGATVTASIRATRYGKGQYYFDSDAATPQSGWIRSYVDVCPNEDVNQNGILDTSEDSNGNGVLDPRTPFNVSSTGLTDSTGTATVSILYPKDRAGWTEVMMTVRGSVSGTEASYSTIPYFLPVLAADVSSETIPPPGVTSPYGVRTCNLSN